MIPPNRYFVYTAKVPKLWVLNCALLPIMWYLGERVEIQRVRADRNAPQTVKKGLSRGFWGFRGLFPAGGVKGLFGGFFSVSRCIGAGGASSRSSGEAVQTTHRPPGEKGRTAENQACPYNAKFGGFRGFCISGDNFTVRAIQTEK